MKEMVTPDLTMMGAGSHMGFGFQRLRFLLFRSIE